MGEFNSDDHCIYSPGEGNGNPLQHACLENPMNRGAWWATYSPGARKRIRHDLATKQLYLRVGKNHLEETEQPS